MHNIIASERSGVLVRESTHIAKLITYNITVCSAVGDGHRKFWPLTQLGQLARCARSQLIMNSTEVQNPRRNSYTGLTFNSSYAHTLH